MRLDKDPVSQNKNLTNTLLRQHLYLLILARNKVAYKVTVWHSHVYIHSVLQIIVNFYTLLLRLEDLEILEDPVMATLFLFNVLEGRVRPVRPIWYTNRLPKEVCVRSFDILSVISTFQKE